MKENIINHLAIVMDGNARWAARKGLPKNEGHKQGALAAQKLLNGFLKTGIPNLTLYAFSSENWQRSSDEVSFLFDLLASYLKNEIDILHKNQIRLKFVGNFEKVNKELMKIICSAEEVTKNNIELTLYIAFSYGGRQEIVDTCQKIIDLGVKQVTQEIFQNNLYDPEMPEVDLLIRPSGVHRISNFLLWQSAYAELYFTPKLWPEFNEQDLNDAIDEYRRRTRNFGGR